MYVREGGLKLCQCRHPKAYHFKRALYYLPPQGDSQGNPAPMTEGEPCAYCGCAAYEEGEYQGFDLSVEGKQS